MTALIFTLLIILVAVIGTPLFIVLGGLGLYAHLVEEIPLLSFFIQLDEITMSGFPIHVKK